MKLLRIYDIIGSKEDGIEPLIPVSKSTWWAGVRSGRFPKAVKVSSRVTCWKEDEVLSYIASLT